VGAAGFYTESMRADCEVGAGLTRRLGLPVAVSRAVLDGFERFDGRGAPAGRSGTDVAEAARFAAVGYTAVMFDAVGGSAAASEMVARWSGRALDPAIAAVFRDAPEELLEISTPDDLWAAAVDAEPAPRRTFRDDAALDEALAGFGDASDLKTPWFHGHSGGVARLARAAAERLASADATLVYRAGLLHDLGRVAVPTGIWERPGPLRAEEWELVRLHPYHSGRILVRSPVLAPLGPIASRHHERTDGSGYPAGVRATELDAAACLLAAADVLHALGEPRPHRGALDAAEASRVLSGLPLDRDAVRLSHRREDRPNSRWSRPGLLPTVASTATVRGATMTTDTAAATDIAVVGAGFEAFQGRPGRVRQRVLGRCDLESPQRRSSGRDPPRTRRDRGLHRRVGPVDRRHAPRRAGVDHGRRRGPRLRARARERHASGRPFV
jgi:HD-GYP domain-containing protein (c-di-GMP phosphodiesterase class II)